MTDSKTSARRGEPVRRRVIDAAERLLRQGKAEFSMRDLSTEAGVSFATPFNQFGSKHGIMLALSHRRIETMAARYDAAPPAGDAPTRILHAVDIAAAVMLEEPAVNRAVMGWLGTPGDPPGQVLAHSTALWRRALGDDETAGLHDLATRLAFAFRGVLSFWTAGELPDAALAPMARDLAAALLHADAPHQPKPPPR
ncbi:TetR/AcrR family transcriptional regulator [Sphingomonas sp. HF-S3]|uniref:TetR/AcrR family transcriptional regulator n=1 Tax=Sphingomonas rustica TaxID=3103142 RepID=A0ABV0BFJ2_9SPHN